MSLHVLLILLPSTLSLKLGYDVVGDTPSAIREGKYDVAAVIAHSPDGLTGVEDGIREDIRAFIEMDPTAAGSAAVIPSKIVPKGRLVYSPTGSVDGDYDDVRSFKAAGHKAMKKAMTLKAKSVLLVISGVSRFRYSEVVAAVGALDALYIPQEVKSMQNKTQTVTLVGIALTADSKDAENVARLAKGLDAGRVFTRDLQGGNPETLTPPLMADIIKKAFGGSSTITVDVLSDQEEIKKNYPGVEIVNRGCNHIEGYRARVVKLEYSKGKPKRTLMLVGKGVTFDTGGHDIKIHGGMHDMRLDKGGASSVAGLFMVLNELQPNNLKVVGRLSLVRNCIGSRAYLPSELFKARSGKILRVVNTDCEGRLVMLDPLSEMRELATKYPKKYPKPHLFTFATLTGHAYRAFGAYGVIVPTSNHYHRAEENMYTPASARHSAAIMDNYPAEENMYARRYSALGDQIGEPIEVSRVRPEDFKTNRDSSPYSDLKHSPPKPTADTARGHQIAFAFLTEGSGLLDDGVARSMNIPYTHVDMLCIWPINPLPNGCPLMSMSASMVFPHLGI